MKIEIKLSEIGSSRVHIDFDFRKPTFVLFVSYPTTFLLQKSVVNLKRLNKVFGTPDIFKNDVAEGKSSLTFSFF